MRKILVTAASIGSAAVFGILSANAAESSFMLAKELAPAKGGGSKLLVTSDSIKAGQVSDRYTQNGENVSPSVNWTKGPTGTQSYAIILEDAGLGHTEPVAHWVVYDLPSTATRISENQPTQPQLLIASQGLNVRDASGFLGPKPPAGETHSYHMQVFALNTRLKLDPAKADRDDVVKAMKGHVLGLGEALFSYTGK